MNERVRVLCEEAAKLTPEERVELVERINLTLLDRQAQIEDAWDREAARRFEAYERGEMKVRGSTRKLRRRLRSSLNFPEASPKTKRGARRYNLKRFPYYLIYQVKNDEIIAGVVAHGHREPFYW